MTNETNTFSGKLAAVLARRDTDRGKLNPWPSTLRTLEDCMQYPDLSLPRIEGNSSRFTPGVDRSQSVKIETHGSPEPNIRADLQRAKGRLKLLLELANQTVSKQELQDVVRAVMMSIRDSALCDGVCLSLESAAGGNSKFMH